MEKMCIMYGVALLLVAGCICMPNKRLFLDVDCDKKIVCDASNNNTDTDTDDMTPVCATDGHTYDSKCHMDQEIQRRYCVVGDFNPIGLVHQGNCTDQEASDMLW